MLERLAKSKEELNILAEHYRTCQNVAAIERLALFRRRTRMHL